MHADWSDPSVSPGSAKAAADDVLQQSQRCYGRLFRTD